MKSLFIIFRCFQFNDERLKAISKALKEKINLERIDLNFNSIRFSNEAFVFLAHALKKLTKLNSVGLRFESCGILNKSLLFMIKTLEELSDLKILQLDFQGCPEINEESFNSVTNLLNKSNTLENFYLSLDNKELISVQAIEVMYQRLKQINSLNMFTLNFYASAFFCSFEMFDCKRAQVFFICDPICSILKTKFENS